MPSQVDAEFGGAAHAVQEVGPQELVLVLLAQVPAHSCEPVLHVAPHEMPSHVAVPLTGCVHATHDAPQLVTLALLTQAPPQR